MFFSSDHAKLAQCCTNTGNVIRIHLAIVPSKHNAVGTGLPGIPRADLMVLPDADWQRLKDSLTYEAWAAKTTANEEAAAKAAVH